MKTITERLKLLIDHTLIPDRKFKALEEVTGIPSGTWRTWWNRNGKPSGDMIEAVAKRWPECAFWLVTGITDPRHGHVSPDALFVQRHPRKGPPQREQAAHLFKALIEISAIAESGELSSEMDEKISYLQKLREAEEQLLGKLEEKRRGEQKA